jgi:DNA-binding CsgD family transcriptional regulator
VGEAVTTAGGVHGFPAVRTSFIGRAGPVRELAVLLEQYRLVTVTGPGGSGKTRLAGEVAGRVAGRFAGGVWLVELAPVQDPGQVRAAVAAALGVRDQPGVPVAGTLARVLARQQLLLVLDNCEHVLGAAAGLCAELLAACDDLRILATSREGLRVGGEARYRLGLLAVPGPDDLADAAAAEAVVLFADRARQADAHFTLDGRTGPEVGRLVARLDGMPLAIELAAARLAEPGSDGWCAIHLWLGSAAFLASDRAGALDHLTAVVDAVGDHGPSRVLADALADRSGTLLNMDRLAEGAEDGRRSLAMARELGYPAGEMTALRMLANAALYSGDNDGAVQLIRQQELITGMPGSIARRGGHTLICALIEAGDLAAAESAGAAALAWCRDAGDMFNLPSMLVVMTDLDLEIGRFQDAAAHLRDGLQIALRAGDLWTVAGDGLWYCALLCTATGRYAEAATMWAAADVQARQQGFGGFTPLEVRRREEALSTIRQALGPAQVRAAGERGTAMSLDTAAEYALMLTAPARPPAAAPGAGLGGLSARERELVTLVAQGRTNAQIAAQLYISVRTVGSHLDRIRDKTGCRRRADLTRLALTEGLV